MVFIGVVFNQVPFVVVFIAGGGGGGVFNQVPFVMVFIGGVFNQVPFVVVFIGGGSLIRCPLSWSSLGGGL